MKRWEAWWNHAALTAVSLTGLLYGIFKYWVPGPDPDSRAGHLLQETLELSGSSLFRRRRVPGDGDGVVRRAVAG